MTTRSGLAATGLTVCVIATALSLNLFMRPRIALSQVKQQVAETKSVRYVESRTGEGGDETAENARLFLQELAHELASLDGKIDSADGAEKQELKIAQTKYPAK